jgi:predicted nucleic acid-binding protein
MTKLADASYLIAWFLGDTRIESANRSMAFATLPHQYAETFLYFRKHGAAAKEIEASLASVKLVVPTVAELFLAGERYLAARKAKACKASLADAMLAAVAEQRGEVLLALAEDFRHLNFKKHSGATWKVQKR